MENVRLVREKVWLVGQDVQLDGCWEIEKYVGYGRGLFDMG